MYKNVYIIFNVNCDRNTKNSKKMRRINKRLGIVLAISGILSGIANYFNVLATPTLVTSLVIAAFVAFIVMMLIYNYQSYQEYNPGTFWLVYSALGGAFFVFAFYAMGFNLISQSFSVAIAIGILPILLPTIGLFLGDCGRILLKSEPSAI